MTNFYVMQVAIEYFSLFARCIEIDSRLLNTEKRIHGRPRETKVERKKKKNPFSGAAREPKSAPPFLCESAREERRPREPLARSVGGRKRFR